MIPKNKTISILHPYVNKKGGAVKMMIYLSNLLTKKGNNVCFFAFKNKKELKVESGKLKGNVFHEFETGNLKLEIQKKSIFGFFSIAYKIRKSDYIIIGNSPMQFVGVISKIFFFSKAKLIWWHHHYPWYYSENTNFLILLKRLFEKLSIKFIDTIIVNSNYLKDSLKKIYSIDAKILYPVIDEEFVKVEPTKKDFTKKTMFTYGRRVKGKNAKQIFQTYEYLQKNKISNVKLLVGGVGEELDFYKNKYKKDENISFLGLLDNSSIIENFQKSLVFLFPSKIDSFGMTILEAMSCGVPTIAFALNGAFEMINNGKSGFLVNSSEEFSKKTLKLLTNQTLCKDFSKKSLKISFNFSESKFKKQLENIF